MNSVPIERDERTEFVENASYRVAYMLISFGVLLDIMYRGQVRHEAAWDLFALVIVGGAVARAYQGRQKVLAPGWAMKALLLMTVAAFVAAALVLVLR